MKSVAFLRNTWKKWERKTSDNRERDNADHPKPPSSGNHRSLTITVNHLPLSDSKASSVDGVWHDAQSYKPPSPIYDQFTQHRNPNKSRRSKDHSTYLNVDSQVNGYTRPSEEKKSGSVRIHSLKRRSPTTLAWPKLESRPSLRHKQHTVPRHSTDPSPQSPTLPSYEMLPPIDLSDPSTSPLDCFSEQDIRFQVTSNEHPSRRSPGPFTAQATEEFPRVSPTKNSKGLTIAPTTVQAVLDFSFDSRQRSLYHSTGSTPHLLYTSGISLSGDSDGSLNSPDGSDIGHFPLSLFPVPPPLTTHRSIQPAPLVLRNPTPGSRHSSRDSTPVGTPTTPRFHSFSSSTSPSNSSPAKRLTFGRSTGPYSPPPSSPPNVPLPEPPINKPQRVLPGRPRGALRSSHSHINLSALPFPPTHRLTASEPITDNPNFRTRRSTKARAETLRSTDLKPHIAHKDRLSGSTDIQIQWGYAL